MRRLAQTKFARITMMSCVLVLLGVARSADAQDWSGLYIGGAIGAAMHDKAGAERVGFDTNLDGGFDDTVRTAGGADAFAPGFCAGLAVGATAAGGCTDDESGIEGGGRVGYDWQMGRAVIGGLVDVSSTDVTDHVTAFSVTPAFYSFSRTLKYSTGFRGRAGVALNRLLLYGTGGALWARVGQRFTTSNMVNTFVAVNRDSEPDADGFASQSEWGYQGGAGAEWRLMPRLTVSGEYLWSSIDDRDSSVIRSQGPAPATNPFILVNAAGTNLRRTDRFEFQTVRAGLNVRF